MIRGIYTATAGLANAQARLGVVSNNIANASTTGFRQDLLTNQAARAMDLNQWGVTAQGGAIGSVALGPQVGASQVDLTPGPLQETSNPLDLALAGTGFFTVQGANGQPQYTRDGGFHTDPNGALLARDNSQVMGVNGQPIVLPLGADVAVAADGTVLANGASVAQLQLVDFPAGAQLTKLGSGMFAAPAGVAATPIVGSQVYQGYLEGSNVDLSESMVSTMNLVRAYESNQKMLQMQDETLVKTVNEVGKV